MGEEMETNTGNEAKKQLLQHVRDHLNGVIGRRLDETEERALAFLIDKKGAGVVDPVAFVTTVLAVQPGDNQRDVAWKTHLAIRNATLEEYDRQVQTDPQRAGVVTKLRSMSAFIHQAKEKKHKAGKGLITIGAVPKPLEPAWLGSKK